MLLRAVLDLLAPPRCLACGRPAELPWCPRCARQVRRLDPGCVRCGARREAGHPCWPADAPIVGTVARFDYRGPVTAAVTGAKLRGAWAAWEPLADRLSAAVAERPPEVDAVTWITTPGARVRERGGDHAKVLAAAVARRLRMPLVRLLDAQPTSDDRDHYRARYPLPGSRVLLVDDVVTTGATAVRAAQVLREAGADEVHLAVLARAGAHPLTGPTEDARTAPAPAR